MSVTQRRGRRIMMSPDELDAFLAAERTCRVATVSGDGAPHVSALWFAWDGISLWLFSITRSKRWADLRKDQRMAVVIDSGVEYGELRGVELSGTAVLSPEPSRAGEPRPGIDPPEQLFARKYFGMDTMPDDGKHAWIRLTPDAIASWDFRKLADLQARP
ncbi:pyridoxamine 5'-phosphate oxidase family protein [Streptomyces longisporoflavus]|uniref:Pyridoxamine 5'-phosphate oxidase family protein n=1 Tax=Streptomyces longisporoflavus TaxID=28044 RepID=A0ABW7QMC6_9ACTN